MKTLVTLCVPDRDCSYGFFPFSQSASTYSVYQRYTLFSSGLAQVHEHRASFRDGGTSLAAGAGTCMCSLSRDVRHWLAQPRPEPSEEMLHEGRPWGHGRAGQAQPAST